MIGSLSYRKAVFSDLNDVLALYAEQDELAVMREQVGPEVQEFYLEAFKKIDRDLNHYLMVVEKKGEIVGTCHLTLLPCLTLMGRTRLQIESVRVKKDYRGNGVGKWMIEQAVFYGKSKGATLAQLTTNQKRIRSQKFYEGLGFESTHVGMKRCLLPGDAS